MASTYSPNLRIQLITTGEQANTWGVTNNTNLGTLIEEAISGSVSVSVTAGDVTLSKLDGSSDQSRQMVIVATGTPGVARTITAPSSSKIYIVHNNSNAILNFIPLGGAGVSFAVGAKKIIYFDGTNFVEAINALTSPALGTPSSGTLTSCTGLPISTGVFGLGTGVATFLATPSSANLAAAVTGETGSGALVFATSPTIATPTITGDASINGLTVGKGLGGVSTNTAVGNNALSANTTGNFTTAVGYRALAANTTGGSNVAVGNSALAANTTGGNSVAVGDRALAANLTGVNNVASGQFALAANTTGDNSVAVGNSALAANTTGDNSVAVGGSALSSNTTGGSNVAVGYSALSSNISGSSNVGIGFGCPQSTTTVSNEATIYNGSTYARFQGTALAWSFTSDARDKTAIEDLTLGLDFITQLQPRKFQWAMRSSEVDAGKEAAGFIAQEVLAVTLAHNANYTGLVDTNNPDQYTLATTNLIPMLVNAIKELKAEIDLLKAKV